MSRLLPVELRRLTSRRLVRLLALALLGGLLAGLGIAGYQSNRDLAGARAESAQLAEQQNQQMARDIARCEEEKRAGAIPADVECGPPPGVEIDPLPADAFYSDPRLSFPEATPGAVTALSVVLALLGFVIGATFAGAEWSAGTMAALLTWEPRRLRVLASKLLALSAVVILLSALLLALLVAGLWLIAATRGTTDGTTEGLVTSVVLRCLRGVALAVVAGGLGFGLAGLTRNTGAALGAAFAYFAVAEIGLRQAVPTSDRWLLGSNIGAWLENGITLFRYSPTGQTETKVAALSAALVLGGLVAAVLALHALTLQRRDVT